MSQGQVLGNGMDTEEANLYPSLFSVAVIIMPKTTWGWSGYSPSSKDVRAGTQSGNLEAGATARTT